MGHGDDDRISALHDDLLGKIISCLQVKEAARTAALASRWRHLWRYTPLVLNDEHLPEPTRAAVVARVLAGHPGPFRTVHLRHCSSAFLSRELPEWPRILAAKATQTLVFANRNPSSAQPNSLCLPADILRCSSLEQLFLSFWTLPDQLPRIPVVFPFLQRLTMISITMSDQDLHHLIAASPVLETLVVACSIKHFHLRSQSLRCVLAYLLEDFAVVEAPLLDRLIFLNPLHSVTADPVTVRIASTSSLRVLGYMDPKFHKLQINDNIIKHDTVASPSTVVPRIKILALKVNFSVLEEVKMVPSLLRCFPNVHTLHIQSVMCDSSKTAYEPTGDHHAKFWQEASASPVECLRSHVKGMIFHQFRWHQNEFEFLKFVAKNAKALQSLLLVLPKGKVADEVNEMIDKVGYPFFRAWTSKVSLVSPKVENDWSLKKASDITVDDPFR
uniref:Uncharacterized protein n=1 Tax=Avena sativa TaxID=4498 RepID=A0ACD5ZA05_AVESA